MSPGFRRRRRLENYIADALTIGAYFCSQRWRRRVRTRRGVAEKRRTPSSASCRNCYRCPAQPPIRWTKPQSYGWPPVTWKCVMSFQTVSTIESWIWNASGVAQANWHFQFLLILHPNLELECQNEPTKRGIRKTCDEHRIFEMGWIRTGITPKERFKGSVSKEE